MKSSQARRYEEARSIFAFSTRPNTTRHEIIKSFPVRNTAEHTNRPGPSHPAVHPSIRRLRETLSVSISNRPASSPVAPAPNPPASDPSLPRRVATQTDRWAATTLLRQSVTSSASIPSQLGPRVSQRETPQRGGTFVEASPEQSPRERVPIRDRNPGSREKKQITKLHTTHTRAHTSGEAARELRPRPSNLLEPSRLAREVR